MSTITNESVRHMLTSGYEETLDRSTKALLFGHLADLAWPIVTHYRSDLYHDVSWIMNFVDGPCTFYFSVDEYGTSIGQDRELVSLRNPILLWKIELQRQDNRTWYLWVTPDPEKI